jgi:hypothetical protein
MLDLRQGAATQRAVRRGAKDPGVGVAQQVEPGHELLVEDGHLAAQDQDVRPELRDRAGQLVRRHPDPDH